MGLHKGKGHRPQGQAAFRFSSLSLGDERGMGPRMSLTEAVAIGATDQGGAGKRRAVDHHPYLAMSRRLKST